MLRKISLILLLYPSIAANPDLYKKDGQYFLLITGTLIQRFIKWFL
jgi:hypothetical protein